MPRILTEIEKSTLVDMIAKGYSRSHIVKKLKTKNDTLERICEENNIPLIKKGNSTFVKDDIDGILVVKGQRMYFRDSSCLYFLLSCESDPRVKSVEHFQETFKMTMQDGSISVPAIVKQRCPRKFIQSAVENRHIKFFNTYLNQKLKIDYTL